MLSVHVMRRRSSSRRPSHAAGRAVATLFVTGLLAFAPASTALASDNGSVSVTVTASGAACITLSSSPTFNFGTGHFSTAYTPVEVQSGGTVTIKDCSGLAQSLQASVSGLSDPADSKHGWSPIDTSVGQVGPNPCDSGLNKFIFKMGHGGTLADLSGTLTTIDSVPVDNVGIVEGATLVMPCAGSDDSGHPMSGSVQLVALLS
jgi:hypothetical protein